MKKISLAAAFVILVFSGMASAQDHGFGLGIIVGEPTGVSLKTWTGGRTALDLAPSTDFYMTGGIGIRYYFD